MGPGEFAREAEARGLESVWFPEHTHIPTGRTTPYPKGGDLPEQYRRTVDPLIAIAAAAEATSTIRLATGVSLVAQHDPITLAKSVSSIDQISGGRFIFGIGVGWNIDEMVDHGVDPKTRRALVRDKVFAMKRLWADEVASYEGRFVHLPPTWQWPKPVQQPHPPIVMGAAGGPLTFKHVAEYCDGFMPIHERRDLDLSLRELREACNAADRDPATVELGAAGVPIDRKQVDLYEGLGFARVVVAEYGDGSRDDLLHGLDRAAALM
jgi:probable F420-dependent oxidoreductase